MANLFFPLWRRRLGTVLGFVLAAIALSACTGSLAPGLVARMDRPGAVLDRAEAINIINQYRMTRGAGPLIEDTGLNAAAGVLARRYSASGTPPQKPDTGIVQIRFSAGYANFAETFSGWRNRPQDADAIADPAATRAGLAVVYAPNSAYGTHWVLLLGAPVPIPLPVPLPVPVPVPPAR